MLALAFQSLFWWILYCDTYITLNICFRDSFNPCFGGSYIVTKSTWLTVNDTLQFQSLFWWILYCDFNVASLWYRYPFSFNPCFGGSYIVTRPYVILYRAVDRFQSLFWWILYCDELNCIKQNRNQWGFNPCFGGSYIVTYRGEEKLAEMQESFNPCFGGSYIVTMITSPTNTSSIVVSILVLVDLILWQGND